MRKIINQIKKRKKEYMHKKIQNRQKLGYSETNPQQIKHDMWSDPHERKAKHDHHRHERRHMSSGAFMCSKHAIGYVESWHNQHEHKHTTSMQTGHNLYAILQEKRHLKRRIRHLQRKLWALNYELRTYASHGEQPHLRHSRRVGYSHRRPDVF